MGFFEKVFGTICLIGLTGACISVYFILRGSFFAGEPLGGVELFAALACFLVSTGVCGWGFGKMVTNY